MRKSEKQEMKPLSYYSLALIDVGIFLTNFALWASAQVQSDSSSDENSFFVDVSFNEFEEIRVAVRPDGQPSVHVLPGVEISSASVRFREDVGRQVSCFFMWESNPRNYLSHPLLYKVSEFFTPELALSQPFFKATHLYCYDSTADDDYDNNDSTSNAEDDLFIIAITKFQTRVGFARVRTQKFDVSNPEAEGELDEIRYEAKWAKMGVAVGTLDLNTMADSDLGPETLRTALIRAPGMSEMNTDEEFYMPKAFCESKLEFNIPERSIPAGFQINNPIVFSL